jgi:hypothetical protein
MTWITNSQGESDLLNQVQVVSTEFNERPVLQDGKVTASSAGTSATASASPRRRRTCAATSRW